MQPRLGTITNGEESLMFFENPTGFESLPDEISLRILRYLSRNDLAHFGWTQKHHLVLSQDNNLWKALLLKDFHFTEDALAYYFQQKKSVSDPNLTYQQFYQQCQNDKPSPRGEQLIARLIEKLKDKGLTANHLKGRPEFCQPKLDPANTVLNFENALIYLIEKCNPPMVIPEAVATLRGLTGFQAWGVTQGLVRDEVLACVGQGVKALVTLKPLGLTAELLATLKGEFSQSVSADFDFKAALVYLMKERQPPLTAVDAVKTLRGKTCEEAWDISNGKIVINPTPESNLPRFAP